MALTTVQNELMNAASSTGAFSIPVGTTAQRPAGPTAGAIRYNTTIADLEIYVAGAWVATNYTAAPVNTVAPVISGSTTVGSNLTCTTGTWTNTPTSYAYQWLANSTAITNATSNTFALTITQVGANISCNVTATNIAGGVTATSNVAGPVVNIYTISYLLVAGGGAGGADAGGGGGAGGLLQNTTSVTGSTVYTMTVGAGGAYGVSAAANSTISGSGLSTILSYGGGSGNGGSGGSGGGGYNYQSSAGGKGVYPGSSYVSAPRQGYDGGGGSQGSSGGEGGGAGGTPTGLSVSITGSAVTYATGGSAGYWGGPAGNDASPFLGNGAGGGGASPSRSGGNGGSGIIILSIPTTSFSNTYSGSNVIVTTSGSNTIVKFSSSGTYTA